MFLVNSRPPRFALNSRIGTIKLNNTTYYPLSRSYKAILPSSFNILTSMHLSTLQLTYLCRFLVRFFFFEKYFPDACTLPDASLILMSTFKKSTTTINGSQSAKAIQKHFTFQIIIYQQSTNINTSSYHSLCLPLSCRITCRRITERQKP